MCVYISISPILVLIMDRNLDRKERRKGKKELKRITSCNLDSYLLFWVCIHYYIINIFFPFGFDVLKLNYNRVEMHFGFGVQTLFMFCLTFLDLAHS